MSADPIIYCLERVTDYRGFEQLCSALLADNGYSEIEPLGGTGDKGRDASIRSDETGQTIIFAYTVRSDWRAKLNADCNRVHETGHTPDVFVFVCAATLSASEKDYCHSLVKERYGWALDLYDLERIRAQLRGPQRHLIAQHPNIFTPPFFRQRGGESTAESRDTILIDHVIADHALATWLARRLSLAGFRTWCYGTAPLAGENADDTVRSLLEARAQLYLPIISTSSLSYTTFLERCVIAATTEDFVVPCYASGDLNAEAPSRVARLMGADFNSSWIGGLDQLLQKIEALGIEAALGSERGRQIALRDYLPAQVTVDTPEPIFANVFSLTLPPTMLVYDLPRQLTGNEKSHVRARWPFVELSARRVAAFGPPPRDAILVGGAEHDTEFIWEETFEQDGRRTFDIAKELARRSIDVACAESGLRFCSDRKLFYFPPGESKDWKQPIQHVDGRTTTIQLTGKRTKGWGGRASRFHYQLAPRFRPQRDPETGTWDVVVNLYIRVTATDGTVFQGKNIGRHQKAVSKSWWNKELFARLLAMIQALQNPEGKVQIGEGNRAVVMETTPLGWQCPVGLDVLALSGTSDLGEELAQCNSDDDDRFGSLSTEKSKEP